jgi:hypothetical protein
VFEQLRKKSGLANRLEFLFLFFQEKRKERMLQIHYSWHDAKIAKL